MHSHTDAHKDAHKIKTAMTEQRCETSFGDLKAHLALVILLMVGQENNLTVLLLVPNN